MWLPPLASFSLGLLLFQWQAEKSFWGHLSSLYSAGAEACLSENWSCDRSERKQIILVMRGEKSHSSLPSSAQLFRPCLSMETRSLHSSRLCGPSMSLPRASLGLSSLKLLLALPDIKWPLRVWNHPCGS